MFGVVLSGRPVQLQLQQVSPTKFMLPIANARAISHVTVFMTGAQVFPDGFAAGIYYSVPPHDTFTFLGVLANDKPSAIFKLKWSDLGSDLVQLGISIEAVPVLQLELQRKAIADGKPDPVGEAVDFAKRIGQDLHSYIASFAKEVVVTVTEEVPVPYEQQLAMQQLYGQVIPPTQLVAVQRQRSMLQIPADALDKWLAHFINKVRQHPHLWLRK